MQRNKRRKCYCCPRRNATKHYTESALASTFQTPENGRRPKKGFLHSTNEEQIFECYSELRGMYYGRKGIGQKRRIFAPDSERRCPVR